MSAGEASAPDVRPGLLSARRTMAVIDVGGVQHTDELDQLGAAMARFQAEVDGAPKGAAVTERRNTKSGGTVEFTRHYTRLEDAWEAARAALTRHGLSVMQWPTTPDNGNAVRVVTRVLHESGQWIQSALTMAVDNSAQMNQTQKYGSAITYCCRYSFLAALGLPPQDDDAQAAGAPPARAGKTRGNGAGKSQAGKERQQAQRGEASSTAGAGAPLVDPRDGSTGRSAGASGRHMPDDLWTQVEAAVAQVRSTDRRAYVELYRRYKIPEYTADVLTWWKALVDARIAACKPPAEPRHKGPTDVATRIGELLRSCTTLDELRIVQQEEDVERLAGGERAYVDAVVAWMEHGLAEAEETAA